MAGMESLDHKTAAVIIPTEDVWSAIQAIRLKHDSKVGRGMPHITLVYPFLPRSRWARAEEELISTCKSVRPFEISLARFDQFGPGKGYYTLWLVPEPVEPILDLHTALCPIAHEDAYELDRAIWHFKPHLSVGQVRGSARQGPPSTWLRARSMAGLSCARIRFATSSFPCLLGWLRSDQ